MSLFATRQWSGGDNIPHDGAAIICGNHVAPMDALLYGEMLYLHRVPPRFLAKSDLFDIPIVGMLLRATGQIPVFRGTRRSTEAISAAREALEDGAVLTLFPEGTYTRDPHAWPMKGRRGAARLALATGAPVIPAACWDSREMWEVNSALPRLGRRAHIRGLIGRPMHVEVLEGESELDAENRITAEIMAEVTALVQSLRGGTAPEAPYDPHHDSFRPELGARRSSAERIRRRDTLPS